MAKRSPRVKPRWSDLELLFCPFLACIGFLGLLLVTGMLPSVLILLPAGDIPALTLLRIYFCCSLLTCVVAAGAPCLSLWVSRRVFRALVRRIDTVTPDVWPAMPVLDTVCFFLLCVMAWGVLTAGLPGFCQNAWSDIRQIQEHRLEHLEGLLSQSETPCPMPVVGADDDLCLTRRGAAGPESDFEWVTLRFPKAMAFAPDPESFSVVGESWQWNWETRRRYELEYTSNFHLVVRTDLVEESPCHSPRAEETQTTSQRRSSRVSYGPGLPGRPCGGSRKS